MTEIRRWPEAGPELNAEIARALGYTMYHYDKDVAETCYWMLMDPQWNPVVVDVRTWGRKTEAEAWADAPDFSGESLEARQMILEFVEQHGLEKPFLAELRRECSIAHRALSTTIMWGLLTATNEQYCYALLCVLDQRPA